MATNYSETTERKPWIAVVLTLICTGLGHIYCGRIVKGLVLFLISLALLPVAVGTALAESSPFVWAVFFTSESVIIVIGFYAVIDSFLVARRQKEPYEMQPYNHPLVYSLFMLVGVSNPVTTLAIVKMQALEAFHVPASSMAPNVIKGDYMLVNKAAYRTELPQRGDVVVFRSPSDRNQVWVKRIIGLPGDRIAIEAGRVAINGRKLTLKPVPESEFFHAEEQLSGALYHETNAGRTYAVSRAKGSLPSADCKETTVPSGNCFVLGDNRGDSRDSRHFGCVPIGDILGKVAFIYLPASSWSRFGPFGD